MRIPVPGSGRITLAALAVAPAVMAYPWHTAAERWVLGVAVGVVFLLLTWWRGRYLSALLWRRLTMLRGRDEPGIAEPIHFCATDAKTTAALRIVDDTDDHLPLATISGYLERYGIRCEAVRVTSRDVAAGRTSWIGLTLSASANMAALQARSASVPLRETADVMVRRLADHLRELGWTVSTADLDVPDLLGPQPRERWRAVQDGAHGYLAGYGIVVDETLDATLHRLWTLEAPEVWTALEITGTAACPELAVACAVRTDDVSGAPVPNLLRQDGDQWSAVTALHPLSTERLAAPRVPAELVPTIGWPAGPVAVRT